MRNVRDCVLFGIGIRGLLFDFSQVRDSDEGW